MHISLNFYVTFAVLNLRQDNDRKLINDLNNLILFTTLLLISPKLNSVK